jgi:hypothetical protein
MIKKQVENIITYVGLGTIITISVGSYIINQGLSKFQLVDFNLLQPHAISVGLTFLCWLLAHGFYLLLFINLEDFKNISRKKLIFITGIKFMLLLSILFPLLGGFEYYNNPIWTWRIFSWQIDLGRVTILLPFMFCLPFLLFYQELNKKKKDIMKVIAIIILVIAVTASVINFFIYYYTSLFSDLLKFEISIFGIFLFAAISAIETQRGITSPNVTSWFSPSGPPIKTAKLTLIFAFFLLSIGVIGILGNYTRNIFPHLPQSIGGGMLERIKYRTERETFEGKKIYETPEVVFILTGDTIRKIEWAEIKLILPSINKDQKNSTRIPFIKKIK